jgi:hypothetical protein
MEFIKLIKFNLNENENILKIKFFNDSTNDIHIESDKLNINNIIKSENIHKVSTPIIQTNENIYIYKYIIYYSHENDYFNDYEEVKIDEKNLIINITYNILEKIQEIELSLENINYNSYIFPVCELYEYEIHKYDNNVHNNTNMKFGDIDDSNENECGRVSIEGSEQSSENDKQKSSCDPIKSIQSIQSIQNGGNKIIGNCLLSYSSYDIDNIYNNYKTFFAKMDLLDLIEMNDDLDEENIKKIIKNVKEAYNMQKKILEHNKNKDLETHLENIDKISEINEKDIDIKSITLYELLYGNDSHSGLTTLISIQNNTALIYNIDIKKKNKIILFGDFHGSFHTFFRILCRLHRYGVIDLETLIINDDYKIIFLGDLIDRGNYGIDILNIIFKLITINNSEPSNPKILLNRGNHEEYSIYNVYGFIEEIETKFNNKYLIYQYQYYLLKYFCIAPSAIIINQTNQNNTNRIWCCHGGFPQQYLTEKIPSDKIILINNEDSSNEIRWSDFGLSLDIYYKMDLRSGRGKYNILATHKFLLDNNINFIIRGHQDSIGNSVLFNNNGNKIINNIDKYLEKNKPHLNYDSLTNLLYYNNPPSKTYNYRVHGPIAKLRLYHHFCTPDYYPVLTISTNTDIQRPLIADSFALLRFENFNGKDDAHQFENNALNIINSIRDVLKNSKIDKKSIIITNLNYIYNILNILFFKPEDLDQNINDDRETIKYISSFISIYKDCIDIGEYYINKIMQILEKIKDLNKPNIKLINIDVLNKYKEELTTINVKYKSMVDKMNATVTATDIKKRFNYKKIICEEKFTQIKNILDEYYKYNDIDVWRVINKN